MPDWDEDSSALRENLRLLLRAMRDAARQRQPLSLTGARAWHIAMMRGLITPNDKWVGCFRGERGLTRFEVDVGSLEGVPARAVASELARFEQRLNRAVTALDALLPTGAAFDADRLGAVIDLAAWAHAEWVRIHPFANGNGRTARLWANAIAMRYDVPPFVRLRPRPNLGYTRAAQQAMHGDWEATASVFRELLRDTLGG
jgi:fido (protein-threonine AMPylation protein)